MQVVQQQQQDILTLRMKTNRISHKIRILLEIWSKTPVQHLMMMMVMVTTMLVSIKKRQTILKVKVFK